MNISFPVAVPPLLLFTLMFMMGISWSYCAFFGWLPVALIIVFMFCYFLPSFWINNIHTGLALCFFITGALRYEQQKNQYEVLFRKINNAILCIKGSISDIEISEKELNKQQITIGIQYLFLYKTEIDFPSGLALKISVPNIVANNVRIGDTVMLVDIFLRMGENEKYKRHLIKENLLGYLPYTKSIIPINRPIFSFGRWFSEKRNLLLEKTKIQMNGQTFSLFSSIFWGKKEIDQEYINPIKNFFKTWGIVHYLARSGLHVLLLMLFWSWLFSYIPLPFLFKQYYLLLIALLYCLFSWTSISFIRSLLLFILYKICMLYNLQIHVLHLLSLTCLIILLINPFQLFFIDFQLSFGLTFALVWLSYLKKS